VPTTDPLGRDYFWLTVKPLERHREGTDLWAVEHGYVSLTPLRLDLTDYGELERITAADGARAGRPTRPLPARATRP
jgi:5'-nucleotidase